MTDNIDNLVSLGEPYFRVVQPKAATSEYTASSYLRLGSYVDTGPKNEATGMVTGLKTSFSEVTEDSRGAEEYAKDAKANVKNDPGKVYSATSQAEKAYTTSVKKRADDTLMENIVSSNKGILLYTDDDLNEMVLGAALHKYGAGDVTEVVTADAKYTVTAGKYDLYGHHGVFIKGGKVESNGSVTKAANIELTAGGYIKQTAYGPLEETTHGKTEKIFKGEAYDEFYGFKRNILHGREETYKMSGVLNISLAAEMIIKLGSKFDLTAGIDLGIRLAADLKYFIGAKIDCVIGIDTKIISGESTKITPIDIKLAHLIDMKKVGINLTVCDFDLKKQFIAADSVEGKMYKKTIEAGIANLKAGNVQTEAKIASLCAML